MKNLILAGAMALLNSRMPSTSIPYTTTLESTGWGKGLGKQWKLNTSEAQAEITGLSHYNPQHRNKKFRGGAIIMIKTRKHFRIFYWNTYNIFYRQNAV